MKINTQLSSRNTKNKQLIARADNLSQPEDRL